MPPVLTRPLPPLAAVGLLAAASACSSAPTAESAHIVSFTEPAGAVCTSVVVVSPGDENAGQGDETESSTDCETAPPERSRVEEDRRPLPDPRPDEEWAWVEMVTATDAHGRACTVVAVRLGTGVIDETSLDCDYPPVDVRPGPVVRTPPPDPDPESDDDRVQVVSFADEHGRSCVTTTARGGLGVEVDITCEYTDKEPPSEAVETPVPG
ncbi:hypothetical protein O4J56_19110 [Nocardiopsis sp. RSe5-2]|uniref:DUF4333 domain-containing protein n=1 Tax=Nocardiopsis endophytica TaxID=3018445 RepID=A0ABT4U730_9ACTN|nr:hypothetical protein [Nocardiopsis endophytica]MDA2812763.1 hypothetical protein [Nocardiopsis endophytica]